MNEWIRPSQSETINVDLAGCVLDLLIVLETVNNTICRRNLFGPFTEHCLDFYGNLQSNFIANEPLASYINNCNGQKETRMQQVKI